jgi:SAM-dependent methyltransferase
VPDLDCKSAYIPHARAQVRQLGAEAGARAAIGGDFEAIGKLEYHLLLSLGLREGHRVLDIGCGCGRLAAQLARLPGLSYGGTDVAPQLLRHARAVCGRPFWDFVETDGASIPFRDASADFVCLFSVVTHLLHEQSFRYFIEAERCLRDGGLLVVSFLEFRVPSHWAAFEVSVRDTAPGAHLTQFIDRDAVASWAAHSGLEVEGIRGGDTMHIPIPEEVVFESGARQGGLGSLGQSVAVLRKPGRG